MIGEEVARDRILNRAMQMASVQGINGVSIGKVAQAVHMSKGGICAHFHSKSDLQLAIIRRAAYLFEQTVIIPVLGKKGGLYRLQALGETWFRYLSKGTFEGGCFFTNAVLEMDGLQHNAVRDAVMQEYQRFIEFVQNCAREALQNGEFRPEVSVEQFSFEFIGVLLGAIVWRGVRPQGEAYLLAEQAISNLLSRSSI